MTAKKTQQTVVSTTTLPFEPYVSPSSAKLSSMKPPSTVRFLGRNISISFKPKEEMEDCYGENIDDEMKIFVREGLLPLEEADVVLHELCHEISFLLHLELSEQQVRLLATSLVGIFQDNPALASYLTRPMGNATNTQAAS